MLNVPNYYVPTHVGPSKLDQALAYCTDLSDDNKQKVIIITDIARLGKLFGVRPMSPTEFYILYDWTLEALQMKQHDLQVGWNTKQYHDTIQGADF